MDILLKPPQPLMGLFFTNLIQIFQSTGWQCQQRALIHSNLNYQQSKPSSKSEVLSLTAHAQLKLTLLLEGILLWVEIFKAQTKADVIIFPH